MDDDYSISFSLIFFGSMLVLSLGQVTSSGGMALCDKKNNKCLNGVCELQANKQVECTCYRGFIKDPTNPLVCHPIPPCNLMPGNPEQQCLNGFCQMLMEGRFGCLCHSGFQLSPDNPNICENVDECALGYNNCAQGACSDLIGGHACSACNSGYTLTQFGKCERPPNNYGRQWFQPNPLLMAWLWDGGLF